MKTVLKKTALLEIGMEELPARFAAPAQAQLLANTQAALEDAGLEYSHVDVFGTPRRLAVLIHGLPSKAKDREDVAVGPPPAAGRDASGNWTEAALGFARAQKVPVEQLVVRTTPKGERLVSVRLVNGQKTEALLKEIFPALVRKLSFPKSMIWEESGFRFARPIRWVVALCNTAVIRFRLAGVSADRATTGLLSLGGLRIPVAKPEKYKSLLQGRCILADPADRRKHIVSQAESIAKKVKGTVLMGEDHLEEVVHLTEYPVSLLSHFPEKYLILPQEVIVIVLKKHQKFFPIESIKGQLTNAFIGVRNGPSESQDAVRDGYERVVNARLADAQFFYEQDRKVPLDQLVPKLAGVGFHKKLGSLLDKTERVKRLVADIGAQAGFSPEVIDDACRAAHLAKADLLTFMVGEFPELQGVAGRFYALASEKNTVARALEEHYWPLSAEGAIPKQPASALLSVADKMDTLTADFSVDIIPSGSADPYGLRRMGAGIVRILIDQKWPLSLARLIEITVNILKSQFSLETDPSKKLEEFLNQRAAQQFLTDGFRSDEIDAVAAKPGQSLSLILERLHALKTVKKKEEFESLATAIKRAKNILKQASEKGFLPQSKDANGGSFQHQSEERLHSSLRALRPQIELFLKNGQHEQAFTELAAMRQPVDDFFTNVMVMAEDASVREQRLKILMEVEELFDLVADFSKLQGSAA